MPTIDTPGELSSSTRSVHVWVLLMLRQRPAHGYGLVRQLEALGITRHNRGRVYRALRWLEEMGFVDQAWETPRVGPARRIYEVLPAGACALDRAIPSLGMHAPSPDDLVANLVVTMVRALARNDAGVAGKPHAP